MREKEKDKKERDRRVPSRHRRGWSTTAAAVLPTDFQPSQRLGVGSERRALNPIP